MSAFAILVLVFVSEFCCPPALADQTSVGVTVNATTGSHVESSRVSSIPLLPLPMLEIDHVHRQYELHLEGVPQLGPVSLTQSDPYGEALAPSVSYLNGELLYRSSIEPIAIGIGETVLNQRTLDRIPFFTNVTAVHYSRVVGMRFVARSQIYGNARRRVDLLLAVNPAMHGLEDGKYAEDASLFDGSLRWTLMRSRYDIVYGLRYLNYTAAYSSDHSLGDRNHLFMPFVGIDWHGTQRTSPAISTDDPPTAPQFYSRPKTTVGISFLGSNGTRSFTDAYSQTPLNFVLIPDLHATHAVGRFELLAEAFLSNTNANPFGAQQQRWSYVSLGALAPVGHDGVSLGLGETATNLVPLHEPPETQSTSRSEALDLLGRFDFARTAQSEAYAFLRVDPYVHVSSYVSFPEAGGLESRTSAAHGARFDGTLGRNIYLSRFTLSYGLRYINQTTNYYSMGPDGVYLTRSTSLMPFIGAGIGF
ncbi:MAG: hypothetical protein JO322_06460 [Candidatus Eremiobacteraeota bacterium]|nr:hypothetical protein [Candidatus Eremiobacteraeota bacterium]